MAFNYNVQPVDIIGNLLGGINAAQGIKNFQQQNQSRELMDAATKNGVGSPEFQQLKAANPQMAMQLMQLAGVEDDQRMDAMVQDAKRVGFMLQNGDAEGAMNLLSERAQTISKLGGNARDTLEIYNDIRSGDVKAAQQKVADFVSIFDPDFALKQRQISQGASRYAPEVSPIQTDPESGQQYVVVTDRNTGQPQRVDVKGGIAQTPDQKLQNDVRKQLLNQAGEISKDAFNSLKIVRSEMSNLDEAISAIDRGANSGALQKYLPSITEATISLENAANRLGLNVVQSTTFGALSEGELKLAMATAVPLNLPPKELKQWLQGKKKAQQKLGSELRKMAIELGKGETTISEYLQKVGYSEQGDPRSDDDILSQYGL